MTNTLHRQGTQESLSRDYVIFSLIAKGINKDGSGPKLRRFMEICLKHGPVNASRWDDEHGFFFPTAEARLPSMGDGAHATATFDDPERLLRVIEEVKEADLGLSVVISGLLEAVDGKCRKAGIVRHSLEHSLGFKGRTEKLPTKQVLDIATMCGHGVVSYNLVRKMIDYVKMGKLTPEQAADYLAKPCTCGAFNPARAATLLELAKKLG